MQRHNHNLDYNLHHYHNDHDDNNYDHDNHNYDYHNRLSMSLHRVRLCEW